MMSFFKKYWKKILMAVIFVPCIVYALSSIPLLPIGGNNDWAGFWGGYLGSLIGAMVTLFVFGETIKNEGVTRKEEHRIQVIPSLIYEIKNIEKTTEKIPSETVFNLGEEVKERLKYDLIVKNIGLGSAQELSLLYYDVDGVNVFLKPNFAVLQQSMEIVYSLSIDFPSEKYYDDEVGFEKNFSIEIEYKDIFGNVYSQKIPLIFYWIRHYENKNAEKIEKVTLQVNNLKVAKYEGASA